MGTLTKRNKTASNSLERARAIQPAAFQMTINGSTGGAVYIGWAPCACSIHITNQPRPSPANIILTNRDTTRGGQVVFRQTYASASQDTLALSLPADGSPVNFYVAGKFGSPSIDDGDAAIAITDATTHNVLSARTLMVRVRKNANTLTDGERNRFLAAYVDFNVNGNTNTNYTTFLLSHSQLADPEIHRRPSFLPWHRAFTLDLERQLQMRDPSVTVPYWKFDEPAPRVFSPDFIGGPPILGNNANISSGNQLVHWHIQGVPGLLRTPGFVTDTGHPALLSQSDTLNLGTVFSDFQNMERNPHNFAHGSFDFGPIANRFLATEDPIFFLLHCNIDRLWAQWQRANNRWDSTQADSYTPGASTRDGDGVTDTMWPWNGVVGGNRPAINPAPGPAFPQLSAILHAKPSPQLTVAETIDYIGVAEGNRNFFDFDDTAFPL